MGKKRIAGLIDKIHSIASSRVFRVAVLAIFAVQALFLAFSMNMGTPPDETNHIEFIRYYADHSLSPTFDDQEPTWSLGDKTREVDFLYHYIASLIVRVIPGETIELYVIRLLTVIMALLTFLYLLKLLDKIGVSKAAANTAVAVLTNIPMVLMLSAAINNDVTVWLGCVAGALLVLNIWKQPRLIDVLLLLNIIVVGGLLKRTFFPIAVILSVAGLYFVIRRWSVFVASLRKFNWQAAVLSILLVVGLGLFAERVGGNVVQYGSITPSCQRVQGEEACKVMWQEKRNRWIAAGAPDDATNIWLPHGTTQDDEPMPLAVFIARWLGSSAFNIVDVQAQGWQHTVMPPVWLVVVLAFLLLAPLAVGTARDVGLASKNNAARQRLFVLLIPLAIVAAQFAVNYSSYQRNLIFGLALNGRYLLPAVLLLAGLSAFYLARSTSKRVSVVVGVGAIVATVAFSGIIMMVRNPQLFVG